MSDIQWAGSQYWDTAWNPIVGCKPCSPACENCYAAAWAKRFGQSFEPHESSKMRPPRKGIVFCGNMTDLFGEWLWPNKGFCTVRSSVDFFRWTTSGISKVGIYKDATFLWLTKRVDAMCDALGHYVMPRNHYFGFTAENQEWYEKRLEPFLDSFPKWAQAWVSAEPLLGHIGFMFQNQAIREKIRWVVVGCESGRNRRKCPIEFVEDVVDQCRRFDVPVFVKQICLPNGRFTNKIEEFPEHLRIRQVPWAKEGEAIE